MEAVVTRRIGDVDLELLVDDSAFKPTTITDEIGSFAIEDSVKKRPGCSVLDLGTGIGPIAIAAAKSGAGEVYGIDIMPSAIELAKKNAERNGVADKIKFLVSDVYSALSGKRFDIIINDISAMDEDLARKSPWYPPHIPNGGADGTEPTLRLIDDADKYLNPGGVLYLPYITLANFKKIISHAQEKFGERMKEIFKREIPFCKEFYENLPLLMKKKAEGAIDFIKKGSRYKWMLHITRVEAPGSI